MTDDDATIRVVVLGAGRMGSQIALDYARAGHHVLLVARSVARAEEALQAAMTVVPVGHLGDGLTRLSVLEVRAPSVLAEAWNKARTGWALAETDLVVESLPENYEVKTEWLREFAKRAPNATLASNTSSLSIEELGLRCGAHERLIGTHYLNPPLLLALVEVIPSSAMTWSRRQEVLDILRAMSKMPIVLEREVPGFVWNRLQFALMREALALVETGVVTAEEIDTIVEQGLGPRWVHTGIFKTAYLGGISTWMTIGRQLLPELSRDDDLDGLAAIPAPDAAVIADAVERRNEEWMRRIEG